MKTSFQRLLSLSILTLLALTFGILGVTSASAAGILYVKAGHTGNCASWAKACDLQTALTRATSGTAIWVAAGTYKPGTTRTATFRLKNGVAIYGGFAGTETALNQRNPTTHVTILSGNIGNGTNSNHVVTGTTGATLDGFTITGGSATSSGGGMYSTGNPVLVNIIFRSNRASSDGGGMENYFGNPTLTNVTFIGNRADQFDGGGMNSEGGTVTLTNVTFSGNLAMFGGGLASTGPVILTNVTFSGNLALNKGGGMYAWTATMTKVMFNSNEAYQEGGGMYNLYNTTTLTDATFFGNSASQGGGIYNYSSEMTITNATFNSNSASEGGGIYNSNYANELRLTNATFNNNRASNNGGGINNSTGFAVVLRNVTFRSNSAINYGGGLINYADGSAFFIEDTIFWDNTSPTGPQLYNSKDTLQVNDSVIQGGCPTKSTCTNIITTNPLLGVLSDNGGFTQTVPLQVGSSAIDQGNDVTCTTTDQRGLTRPQGAHCDIGAFEYILPVIHTLTFNSIAAQDGQITESSETSNKGGAINVSLATFQIGDSATKQQYLGLLSFNTGSLPDDAILTGVTLKVKRQAVIGGGDPVATFKGLMIDLKNGFFGSSALLQASDFQNPGGKTLGPVSPILVANTYNLNLISDKNNINKLATDNGLTQIRLRFRLDDNSNALANYLSLYSGNAATAADRPQLVIQYYSLLSPTLTPTPTATNTLSVAPTNTDTPTLAETDTPTPTPSYTLTSTETITPTPTTTETDTPVASLTPTLTPTETETETSTPIP